MSIKQRLIKLEQHNIGGQMLVTIIVNHGMTEQQALNDWMTETGKTEPDRVVFIQRFCERPMD